MDADGRYGLVQSKVYRGLDFWQMWKYHIHPVKAPEYAWSLGVVLIPHPCGKRDIAMGKYAHIGGFHIHAVDEISLWASTHI
jgi:hypothetical protein